MKASELVNRLNELIFTFEDMDVIFDADKADYDVKRAEIIVQCKKGCIEPYIVTKIILKPF